MDEHARFGGAVPEITARAHLYAITPMVRHALDRAGIDLGDIDAVAATPLYGVHHLAGHAAVDVLEHGPLPHR